MAYSRLKIIIAVGIVLALLFVAIPLQVSAEKEDIANDGDQTRLLVPFTPRGDCRSNRAIFVHEQPDSYLDDLLYTAAIPAAVHWEGSTRYDSLLLSDTKIRDNGNLIGDYSYYLEQIEAEHRNNGPHRDPTQHRHLLPGGSGGEQHGVGNEGEDEHGAEVGLSEDEERRDRHKKQSLTDASPSHAFLSSRRQDGRQHQNHDDLGKL